MGDMISAILRDASLTQVTMTLLLAYGIYTMKKYLAFIDGLGTRMDKMLRILTVLATEHRKNHPGSAFENVVDVMDVEPGP